MTIARYLQAGCTAFLLMLPTITLYAAEPAPGDVCSTDGQYVVSAGPEVATGGHMLVCDGANWQPVLTFDRDGASLLQVGNDSGSCTTAKTGRLRYDSGGDTWEYCDGSNWGPFEQAGSACQTGPADCPAIGNECDDGTIFAGCHPTLIEQLFLHPRRQSTAMPWDGGGNFPTVATNDDDGRANYTAIGEANMDTSNFEAFHLCERVNNNEGGAFASHGYTDWYLPSRVELYYLWSVQADINAGPGASFVGTQHWSSTQWSTLAWSHNFGSGSQGFSNATIGFDVRCVRRSPYTPIGGDSGGCTAPTSCPNVGDVCTDGSLFAGFMLYNNSSCEPLYVTNADQSTGTEWKTATGTNDISNPDDHVDGWYNRDNRGGGTFPAFELCENNTYHGKSDWYLPARAELNLLWLNQSAIDANAPGGFDSNYFWASTERNASNAWYQYFGSGSTNGSQSIYPKTGNVLGVRCVRRD